MASQLFDLQPKKKTFGGATPSLTQLSPTLSSFSDTSQLSPTRQLGGVESPTGGLLGSLTSPLTGAPQIPTTSGQLGSLSTPEGILGQTPQARTLTSPTSTFRVSAWSGFISAGITVPSGNLKLNCVPPPPAVPKSKAGVAPGAKVVCPCVEVGEVKVLA